MVSTETLHAQLRDAVFDNDKTRLRELLQHDGVEVDHLDAGGQTLLHLACFWGRMDLVKVLLNAGASLKTRNAASCTALDLATHWGHSAVAEVIRLRGGRSVWEEKLGHLQVEADELRLQAVQSHTQYIDKKRDFEALTADFHALHARFEEAKSARALAEHAREKAQDEVQKQATEVVRLEVALEEMTANYHATLVEKAKAQHLQQESQRETTAVIVHRDEVLRAMQASVKKQEESAHGWQRAEVAAAIAESQRNFAFAERDRFQKKHVAALAELVVVTAKLDATEEELMTLKTDLAEHIYEKRQEMKTKKRTERALSHVFGDVVGDGSKPDSPALPARQQHLVAPKSRQQPRALSPPSVSIKQQRHVTELPSTLTEPSLVPSSTSSSSKHNKKSKHFSLAAREFGERLRTEEARKQKERAKRNARTENQYLTQGLSAPLRASEQFQEEFVAAVQSFSTARSAKWEQLKKERDRQAWFSRTLLARPIATAPHLLGGEVNIGGNGLLLEGDNKAQDGDDVPFSSSVPSAPSVNDNRAAGSSVGTVSFGVYRKYARPAYLDDSSLRPVTSLLEVRMQHAFFASPPREDDSGSGDVENSGAGAAGGSGVGAGSGPNDKRAEPSRSAAKARADRRRSEQPQDDSSSLGCSVSAPSFLPTVSR